MTTLIDASGAFLCSQSCLYWFWCDVGILRAGARVAFWWSIEWLAGVAASNWLLLVNAIAGGMVWSFYFMDQLTTISPASIFAVTAGASIGMMRKLWCQWQELREHPDDTRCYYQIAALMPPLVGAMATTVVIVVRHPFLTPYDWGWLIAILAANMAIHWYMSSPRKAHSPAVRQVGAVIIERGGPRTLAAWQFCMVGSSMSAQALWSGAVQTLLILTASWGRMKQKPNRHTRLVFRLEWFGNTATYSLLIVGWLIGTARFGLS